MSDSFRVPEGKETNVRSELKKLVQLQREIYNRKSVFNEKLLSLKRKRHDLVKEILQKNHRLKEINKHLGDDDPRSTSWLSTWESAELIAEDEGTSFEKTNDAVGTHTTSCPDKKNIRSTQESLLYQLIGFDRLAVGGDEYNLSSLEADERTERSAVLMNERTKLLSNIEGKVTEFEQTIWLLRRERSNLLPGVKAKEIRLASLVQEIDILRELEEKGAQLSSKRNEVNAQQEKVRTLILFLMYQESRD